MSIKLSTGAWIAWLSTGSFKTVFTNGVIGIYSGGQPVDANAVETGDLLAWLTVDGGDFVAGETANGLNLATAAGATISKEAAEAWIGSFLTAGVMGYFRFYSNAKVVGASEVAVRFDGRVGTSRADMIVVTTQATVGGSVTPTTFKLNFSIVA